jgi:hypothetical protein
MSLFLFGAVSGVLFTAMVAVALVQTHGARIKSAVRS